MRFQPGSAVALGLVALVVAVSCGHPGGGPETRPRAELSRPRRVVVRLAEAGGRVRLEVGERLVVATGLGSARARWVVAHYPRGVLRLLPAPRSARRFVFAAERPGRGDVLLVDVAGFPEGPCGRPHALKRCLTPELSWSALDGGRPLRPKVAGFEVVVR